MRAAALYAVVAWAIIESSATILPALGLPEWIVTTIIICALAGFPFCLIGAWIFDFTRGGIVRTPERAKLASGELQGQGRGRLIEFVIIAVLGVAVVWLGWDRLQQEQSATFASDQPLDSIAVLPFANLSDDPANEYFGDGLAEELLNVLVKIDGLRVTARTSSFQYRGQNLDIRDIGRALGVATVLEGSVRKFGQRVRVTAQLIRAEDGFHLWSETFDRDLADIFAVQDEISKAIAAALRSTFAGSGSELGEVVTQPPQTANVAAFEAYLRGRFAMNKRTVDGLAQAIVDFRQAIALDPNYAAAFSGLSDSYLLQASYASLDQSEALRLAEPMMQRAIDLNPDLAEAQASKGFVLGDKGDHEGAVAAFKRAIELNPSYSPAYHWLALRYQNTGRFKEAEAALKACLEVDPNYTTGKRVLLGLLRSTGNDAEADHLARQMATDHADDSLVQYSLSEDALAHNRLVDAVRYAIAAVRLQPDSALMRTSLAMALVSAGDIDRAQQQIEHVPADNPVLATWPMQVAQAKGDFEQMERHRAAWAQDTTQKHGFARINCGASARIGRIEGIIEACGAILSDAGWHPGRPLPDDLNDNVAALLSAYQLRGDEQATSDLAAAIDVELDKLEANGMSASRIGFYRAHMSLFRGDPEPLLARLPQWLERNSISAAALRQELIWAALRDDPRFQALIANTEQREAAVLAEVKALAIPE